MNGPPADVHAGVTWMRRPSKTAGSPFSSCLQQRQLLVGEPAPPMHVDAEVLVLLGAVADAERV